MRFSIFFSVFFYFITGQIHADCTVGNCDNGVGKFVLGNGEVYIGHFKDGLFHGGGKYIYRQGDYFIGQWDHGKPHGKGVYTSVDGSTEERVYDHGVLLDRSEKSYRQQSKHKIGISDLDYITKDCTYSYCDDGEIGIYHYGDGTRYTGQFDDGQPEGFGKCEYINGDLYVGGWKNHAPHGKGILTFSNGMTYAAIWDNGVPKKRLTDQSTSIDPQPHKKHKVKYSDKVDVYALVVGVAAYDHLPSLKYTDDDAYQIFAFLKSPEGGALRDDHIKVLIDGAATKNNILNTMKDLFSKADANDVVMLYLSGHGFEGSFVSSDFDGYRNHLPYRDIMAVIDQSGAKHKLVIVDACHSGSIASKDIDYQPSLAKYYDTYRHLSSGGTALLVSSKPRENSLEYQGLRQGIFTHYLMRGLKGDADKNHDKVVTVSELYDYVYYHVRRHTASLQTPVLTGDYNKKMPVAVIR